MIKRMTKTLLLALGLALTPLAALAQVAPSGLPVVTVPLGADFAIVNHSGVTSTETLTVIRGLSGPLIGTTLVLTSTLTGTTGTLTGTLTDSNATPLAFTNTTANTITNAATGAVVGLTLNNNGAALTGDLLDIALSGTVKAKITNGGGGVFTNITDSALTSGQCPQASTGGLLISVVCGTGTITSVVAGTNLSGGGTSGAVTVNLIAAPTITGTNITAIPDAALVTAPVTAVTASGNVASSGGTTPAITMTATPSFTSITDSGITTGQCVQTSTGGLFVGTGAVCGGGGGGAVSSVTAGSSGNVTSSPTTGAVIVDLTAAPSVTGTYTSSSASPFIASATGANTFASKTTGANTAFILNANGTTPTGDLVDFQLGGVTNASVLNSGGFSTSAATGLTLTGTSGNSIASATSTGDAFILNDTGATSGNLLDIQNNGVNKFSVSPGGLGTFAGGIFAGGSIAGATTIAASSSISGLAASLSGTAPLSLTGTSSNQISSAQSAAGSLVIDTTTTSTNTTTMLSIDNNLTAKWSLGSGGNVTMTGGLSGASTGAFSGAVTTGALSASGIAKAEGSGTLVTLSAIPPLYTQTGTANAVAHSSFGTCTLPTGAISNCTVTFSGTGNAFTSGTTYACNVSVSGLATSGTASWSTQNSSGTATVVTVNGSVSVAGSAMVICTGT